MQKAQCRTAVSAVSNSLSKAAGTAALLWQAIDGFTLAAAGGGFTLAAAGTPPQIGRPTAETSAFPQSCKFAA